MNAPFSRPFNHQPSRRCQAAHSCGQHSHSADGAPGMAPTPLPAAVCQLSPSAPADRHGGLQERQALPTASIQQRGPCPGPSPSCRLATNGWAAPRPRPAVAQCAAPQNRRLDAEAFVSGMPAEEAEPSGIEAPGNSGAFLPDKRLAGSPPARRDRPANHRNGRLTAALVQRREQGCEKEAGAATPSAPAASDAATAVSVCDNRHG